eukprot:14354486-Alexandrium_andersonii.AAC.1
MSHAACRGRNTEEVPIQSSFRHSNWSVTTGRSPSATAGQRDASLRLSDCLKLGSPEWMRPLGPGTPAETDVRKFAVF